MQKPKVDMDRLLAAMARGFKHTTDGADGIIYTGVSEEQIKSVKLTHDGRVIMVTLRPPAVYSFLWLYVTQNMNAQIADDPNEKYTMLRTVGYDYRR